MIKKYQFKLLSIFSLLIAVMTFAAPPAYALPVGSSIYAKDPSGNFTATTKTITAGQNIDFEIRSANTEGDTLSEVRLYITRANNSTRDANGRLATYDATLCTRQGGTNDGFGNCYFSHTVSNQRFSTDTYTITFPEAGTFYVFTSSAKSYATQQAWCTGSPYCSWYSGPAGDNCASYSTECINPPGTSCGSAAYRCSNAVTVTVNASQRTEAPTVRPTEQPTNPPNPSPSPIAAFQYRIAETQAGLNDASKTPVGYAGNPTIDSYTFSGGAGEKQLWVRFFYSRDLTTNFRDHGPFKVMYRLPSTPPPTQAPVADPAVTTVSCVTDTSNPDHTRVTATGTSFGSQAGTLKLGDIDGVITSGGWRNTNIVAVVPRKFTTPQQVVVTRPDGKSSSKPCALDGSLIQFSANLTCRFVNKPVQNASIQIVTESASVGVGTSLAGGQIAYRNDDVEFDQNGTALNVVPTAKLVPTAAYNLVIRAPHALRRKISFVAGTLNTTQTLPGDANNDGKYKLFLGDIIPSGAENVLSITGGDNAITSADFSSLKTKWSPATNVQSPADFNQDKRVNSIDYGCIISNFNKVGD